MDAQNLSLFKFTSFRVLIIESEIDVFILWNKIFKEIDPNMIVIWASSESEAENELFDTFINGLKFDMIVSNQEFIDFNSRMDVQDILKIVHNFSH